MRRQHYMGKYLFERLLTLSKLILIIYYLLYIFYAGARNLTWRFEKKKSKNNQNTTKFNFLFTLYVEWKVRVFNRDKQTMQSTETAKYKQLYCTGWQENEGKCKKAYNYCVAYIASDNSSPTDKYLMKVDNFFLLCTNLKI